MQVYEFVFFLQQSDNIIICCLIRFKSQNQIKLELNQCNDIAIVRNK